MCRNIKTLANFEPPATGTTRPSKANEAAFNLAVDEVTAAANRLIASVKTNAPPRNRDVEAQKARERSLKRFA
jgi:hypothetical protein